MYKKRTIPQRLRTAVAIRDEGMCQKCGKTGKIICDGVCCMAYEKEDIEYLSKGRGGVGIHGLSFDVGHIISEFNGGEIVLENLILLCRRCNRSMGKNNHAI